MTNERREAMSDKRSLTDPTGVTEPGEDAPRDDHSWAYWVSVGRHNPETGRPRGFAQLGPFQDLAQAERVAAEQELDVLESVTTRVHQEGEHACRAHALPLVYGYPGTELFEAFERGEVLLGGCIIEPWTRACTVCGLAW